MSFLLMKEHGRGWYCDLHESFENEENQCECFAIAESLNDDRMTDLWEERTRL